MTATATHTAPAGFEQLYPELRQKEGRVYSDEEVLHLPNIAQDHPYYQEWQIRKESCNRLKYYIEKKRESLKILEVGCGNGWLSQQLAEIPGSKVTGTDVTLKELQQAVLVFNHIPNLQFIYGGLHARELDNMKYDLIIFAASIQYFSSLKEIISLALGKLKSNGEIHILDSPFYKPGELRAAQESAASHYSKLGFPEMTKHYFHHSIDELGYFHAKILYRPSFFNRMLNHKNPFPWLCIKKN